MFIDIRDRPQLNHSDILALNFIRPSAPYVFNRYYRSGLRSHIMAVLRPEDFRKQRKGVTVEGVKRFPKAKPLRMLRIFRTRFNGFKEALAELGRVKLVEKYLAPDFMARSNEFLVDYRVQESYEMVLCGLQEYVEGEILDPWGPLDSAALRALFRRMQRQPVSGRAKIKNPITEWERAVKKSAKRCLHRIRKMMQEASMIPDLAGVGNLVLTPMGGIKLVDINNISKVSCDAAVSCDEKGYPVCDKSVEALLLMEQKLLGRSVYSKDPVCGGFMNPARLKKVQEIEKRFHQTQGPGGTSYPLC